MSDLTPELRKELEENSGTYSLDNYMVMEIVKSLESRNASLEKKVEKLREALEREESLNAQAELIMGYFKDRATDPFEKGAYAVYERRKKKFRRESALSDGSEKE